MKKLPFPKIAFLFCIFYFKILFLSTYLYAQISGKNPDEYVIRTWTIEAGLPQNSINAMVQAQSGYIWLGTPLGLARFDGVKFKIFNRMNTPALKKDMILALYEDQNEVLWIGTDGGGLCSYKNGIWQNYSTQDGLSDDYVRVITSDWQGNLWVGTDFGLNRLSSDGFQIYTTENGLYDNIITAITRDSWGNLWVGTMRGGLANFNEGVFRIYDYDDGLLNIAVTALAADRLGNIWIGTQEGLFTISHEDEIVIPVAGMADLPITTILSDQIDGLWIGTMVDGIMKKEVGSIVNFSIEDGLPDDFIRSLLKDEDGNIWLGTDNGGLVQLKKSMVKNITKENGLPENAVTSVLQDREGFWWIGTRNSGLAKMKENQVISVFNRESGLSGNRVRVLFEDDLGALWIGTEGGGINILQNGRLSQMTENFGLTSNNITAILQDRYKAIWIGTDNGLVEYSEGKVQSFNESEGLTNRHIHVLLESTRDTLYIGTRAGLFRRTGNSITRLNPEIPDTELDVASLYEDGQGTLWIGTNGSGLKKFSNGVVTSFTTEQGLHDNYIFSITEDKFGNLWMSSYNRIFRVSRQQLNEFSGNKISSIISTRFDKSDGMASRQSFGGGQPSFWKTKSGKLYYPTVMGISIFDPNNIPVKSSPPNITIEDVLVDNQSVMSEDYIAIPAGSNSLRFQFSAFDYSAAEKIHFKYQLEGHDQNFVNSRQRSAEYQNLASGKYRFVVKAANNDGVWNEQGAAIEFEILLPIYRKPIFYMTLFILLLSLSGGGILINHRRKFKRQQTKYKTSTLLPERADELVPKLVHLMEDEKLFLDPDLTLIDLAKKLNIHYNHLSRIINERFSLSYNDFVNKYRIEEAKKILSSPEWKRQSVLEIMYETGFYSKSVFNTAFKKFTGMTPSAFRKKYM